MPEAPIFAWGTVDNGVSCVILTMVPYRNVAVVIDTLKIYEKGYKADYILVRNPYDRDLDSEPAFHEYLGKVFKQILRDRNDEYSSSE